MHQSQTQLSVITRFFARLSAYLEELWKILAPGRPYEDMQAYFPALENVRKKSLEERMEMV
jgi:hypothetical protein